ARQTCRRRALAAKARLTRAASRPEALEGDPYRGFRVGGADQRGDHRDRVGAGGAHVRGGVGGDAADGDDRTGDRGAYGAHQVEPACGEGVRLARGSVDRADAEVVGTGRGAGAGLVEGVRGEADHGVGAEEAAGGGHRQVVLTEVDAVGAGGAGDVRTVVHE